MDGKIASSQILRPWKAGWQTWGRPPKSTAWELADENSPDSNSRRRDNLLVAVPARLVVAVPILADATDEAAARDMVRLELEMKGLASGERLESDVVIRFLRTIGARQLMLAMVFPESIPEDAPGGKVGQLEPSPLLSSLEDDTLHLWRELDDYVAVIVAGSAVLCWETMPAPATEKELEAWLNLLVIALRNKISLPENFAIKDWTGLLQTLPAGFHHNSSVSEAEREKGPVPFASPPKLGWLPETRRIARRSEQQRQLVLQVAAVFAILILGIVLGAFVYSWKLKSKIRAIDAEIARVEEESAPLRDVAMRWTQVEPAIEERHFPLEMLHHVVDALPKNGVRLTVFEMSPGRVTIEGEATNVTAATEFFKALSENKDSANLAWEMAPPALQANNMARFMISGGSAETNTSGGVENAQ